MLIEINPNGTRHWTGRTMIKPGDCFVRGQTAGPAFPIALAVIKMLPMVNSTYATQHAYFDALAIYKGKAYGTHSYYDTQRIDDFSVNLILNLRPYGFEYYGIPYLFTSRINPKIMQMKVLPFKEIYLNFCDNFVTAIT